MLLLFLTGNLSSDYLISFVAVWCGLGAILRQDGCAMLAVSDSLFLPLLPRSSSLVMATVSHPATQHDQHTRRPHLAQVPVRPSHLKAGLGAQDEDFTCAAKGHSAADRVLPAGYLQGERV